MPWALACVCGLLVCTRAVGGQHCGPPFALSVSRVAEHLRGYRSPLRPLPLSPCLIWPRGTVRSRTGSIGIPASRNPPSVSLTHYLLCTQECLLRAEQRPRLSEIGCPAPITAPSRDAVASPCASASLPWARLPLPHSRSPPHLTTHGCMASPPPHHAWLRAT